MERGTMRNSCGEKNYLKCLISLWGGTMRNSRGEIDILVLFKAISLKTFYMNIYTTTRKSLGGVPRCHYIFQINTECK